VQQARVLSDDFIAAVAGIAQEGLVDVFDAGVDIGNDDAGRALLDGQENLFSCCSRASKAWVRFSISASR
jgi:hypothetical protein